MPSAASDEPRRPTGRPGEVNGLAATTRGYARKPRRAHSTVGGTGGAASMFRRVGARILHELSRALPPTAFTPLEPDSPTNTRSWRFAIRVTLRTISCSKSLSVSRGRLKGKP